jgi:hypothetical protein
MRAADHTACSRPTLDELRKRLHENLRKDVVLENAISKKWGFGTGKLNLYEHAH